ncbi:MAG: signal peptidase I [Candidatus Bathyarchaeia archaeon]|jgi:signal peptidase I
MVTPKVKGILKTAITIALIPILVAGFWFGLQAGLNTKIFPLFAVTSESMCIPPGECDPIAHTFERTLHVGDLLVIQGVDPKELKTDYPNSDIIIYQNPELPANNPKANIVHRIVKYEDINGTRYFWTKGDGNGYPNVWPQTPTSSIDPWSPISEDYVYGKVIMRIPWIGSLALLSQQYTVIPIILVLIIIVIVMLEFVLPLIKKKPVQFQAV